MNTFKDALHAKLRTYRREALRDGVTGVGFDSLLRTYVAGIAGRLPGAPTGTNALWALGEVVKEILREDAKLREFVL